MAGLDKNTPIPTEIQLHQKSRFMELLFDDGSRFELPYEYLRVSPSAEVRGHGAGQETLQVGKREVTITSVEPVGSYAIKPVFSDGHDSGLYSWDYLYELGVRQQEWWQVPTSTGCRRQAPAASPPKHRPRPCRAVVGITGIEHGRRQDRFWL